MNLACRNCRVVLSAESGCAICDPIRKHLVSVDEDQDERPDLSDVGAEVIAALRKRVRHLKAVIDVDPGDDKAATHLLGAANSVSKIIESARKLQVDAEGVINNMSFVARAKLFVSWYAALPPPHRVQIREQLDRYELELVKPLELPA